MDDAHVGCFKCQVQFLGVFQVREASTELLPIINVGCLHSSREKRDSKLCVWSSSLTQTKEFGSEMVAHISMIIIWLLSLVVDVEEVIHSGSVC